MTNTDNNWIYNNEEVLTQPREYVGFIYLITNLLTGKRYIGLKLFNKRNDWKGYYGSCRPLSKDIKIHGKSNFKREIIYFCNTKEELIEKEIEEQKNRDVLNGWYYNQTIAYKDFNTVGITGENHPMYNKKHSEDTKRKMSEIKKGKNNPNYGRTGEKHPMYGRTGENHPMYNKKHSEDTKRKMSEKRKGKNHPMYGRTGEKHPMYGITGENNPNWGKKHSEDTKKKISESLRKRYAIRRQQRFCNESPILHQ